MKLYYFPIAPNPTKVRIYLAEKALDPKELELEQVLVDLRQREQKSPEHMARNPMGNLPVLEFDDGSFLTESLAIIEYIEELHPDPPMIGTEPAARARVRAIERIAEGGVLACIGRLVHSTRSPIGLPANPEVVRESREALPKPLSVLEDKIGDQPFLAGDRPTIADCTLYAALDFGRIFEVALDPKYERLTSWFDRFGQRESVTGLPGLA